MIEMQRARLVNVRTEAAPPRVNVGARVWLRAPVGRRRPESRLAIVLTRHDVLLLLIPATTLHNNPREILDLRSYLSIMIDQKV